MLDGDLWLANARAANRGRDGAGRGGGPERLVHPVEANELFVRMTPRKPRRCARQGFDFYDWAPGEVRLVTSWDQDMGAVDRARRRDRARCERPPSRRVARRDRRPVHHLHLDLGIDLDRHPRPAWRGVRVPPQWSVAYRFVIAAAAMVAVARWKATGSRLRQAPG